MIGIAFFITGCYFVFYKYESNNIYYLFGILIVAVIVEEIVYSMLPGTRSRRRTSNKKRRANNESKNIPHNRLRSDEVIMKSALEELSWREFERLCYLYFKAKGWDPQETDEGADGGVDLIVYNRDERGEEAIQIKHYIHSGNRIPVTAIRELNSAKRNHDCILASFITTSGYTANALVEADKYRIETYDIHWVERKIVQWQKRMNKRTG